MGVKIGGGSYFDESNGIMCSLSELHQVTVPMAELEAVEVHTDRANTMTYGTPKQVRELVKREYDTFKMADGGVWFQHIFCLVNVLIKILLLYHLNLYCGTL